MFSCEDVVVKPGSDRLTPFGSKHMESFNGPTQTTHGGTQRQATQLVTSHDGRFDLTCTEPENRSRWRVVLLGCDAQDISAFCV